MATKVHTKVKRRLRYIPSDRKRAIRPKTFKSEESAKKYAEKQGINKYTLENMKSLESSVKKLRIVVER